MSYLLRTPLGVWLAWALLLCGASTGLAQTTYQINFSDTLTAAPSGWLADVGRPYGPRGNGLTYGWINLTNGAPQNMTLEGRNRPPSPDVDVLFETLIHMRRTDVTTNVNARSGNWEMELPNGIYQVTVVVGEADGTSANDCDHLVNVEGVEVVTFNQTLTGQAGSQSGTALVRLQDGILTMDAAGGFNTKVMHVTIEEVLTPPQWQVNFSDTVTAAPAGWLKDEGRPYGARGNGLTYGWVDPGSLAPVSLVAFGRNRAPTPDVDVFSETFMHMQYSDVNATTGQDGTWQFALPNGVYQIQLQVGEVDNNDSRHVIRAEGIQLIDFDANSVAPPALALATAGGVVTVTDGLLTIEATGGNNTKITTIEISLAQLYRQSFNFSDDLTAAPAGWTRDEGLGFGTHGGLDFGWVDPVSGAPVSLVDRGRNRTPDPDVDIFRETFNHMRYSDIPNQAAAQDGDWQLALPNGTYQVSVQLGSVDFENSTASTHALRVEGQTILDYTVPVGGIGVRNATAQVTFTDGILNLDALNGVNTKLHLLVVESLAGPKTPLIIGSTPLDGETDVVLNPTISANDIFLPNQSGSGATSLDNSTINGTTVRLYEIANPTAANGALVPASVNGTGGGDAINLTPSGNLTANTWHRLVIDGVTDLSGEPLLPYSLIFQTGTTVNTGGGTGDLSQVAFTNAGVVKAGQRYTTLTVGPDGMLYGLTIGGDIYRWNINPNGTLSGEEILSAWKNAYGGSRTAVGLVFDPAATAGNLIAYVSHCTGGLTAGPEWDGKISRLSGTTLATEELLVTNLPRSVRDHLTNSLTFKPGEPDVLYFNQGSNSAGGRADGAWGNRPERLLSAACLRLDLSLLPSTLPFNVQTSMDPTVILNASTSSPTMSDGTYNPYHTGAPLTIFASGLRNAFDLVWHSNGQLYIPTNGTAGGSLSPASVDGMRRPDGSFYDYSAGFQQVPNIGPNETQRDWLFRVDPTAGIGYYGHPNPLRGEYILNRGNVDANNYASGIVADPNYRGAAFDFEFNKSPNGVIEYRSSAHNGNLQGAILVCRYSGSSDIIVLLPDGTNGDIATSRIGTPGMTGFGDPLDLIEDPLTGNLYVSDYARSEIVLITPTTAPTGQPGLVLAPERVIIDENVGSTSPNFPVTITNDGNGVLTNVTLAISGNSGGDLAVTPATIASIPAGGSVTVQVTFAPGSAGPVFDTLTVSSPNPGVVAQSIPLHGLGKSGEPSLQWVLDTYLGQGVIDVGDDNPATNILHSNPAQYTAPRLGDELGETLFELADPNNPALVEVLGVFGPTSTDTIVALAWYEMDAPTAFQEFFVVDNTPTSNGQTLNVPGGQELSFVPSAPVFGFFSRWPFFGNRILYSEDSRNTFSGNIPHHVRVYALPGESDAYVVATEEHVSGFDFQDIVFIVRNVKPAGGQMAIENLTKVPGSTEAFPSDDRLIFQRIQNPELGNQIYAYDDTATARIHNPGDRPLIIEQITVSDQTEYALPNLTSQDLPLVIPAGGSYDLLVQFIENSGGRGNRIRSLNIASNAGEATLTLAGGYQQRPQGNGELSLANILGLFDITSRIPTSLPWPGEYPTAAELSDPTFPYGEDIVVSEYWQQANPALPVTSLFLYSQRDENFTDISFLDAADAIVDGYDYRYDRYVGPGNDMPQCQMLFPLLRGPGNTNTEISGLSAATIGEDFRIRITSRNTSGNGNIVPATGLPRYLGVRLFRMRDGSGQIVPDEYIGVLDFTPGNHDFNDAVVWFRNIQPAGNPVSFPVELLTFDATPALNQVNLDWQTATEENTDNFVVMRSPDGQAFEPIGQVPAAGFTQETQSYQLTDYRPLAGDSYYQLKTVDFDGAVSYSDVVKVELGAATQLVNRFYPNPVRETLTIELNSRIVPNSPLRITCLNAMGQQVIQQQVIPTEATLPLDVSTLAAGAYVLQLQQAGGLFSQVSFMVVK